MGGWVGGVSYTVGVGDSERDARGHAGQGLGAWAPTRVARRTFLPSASAAAAAAAVDVLEARGVPLPPEGLRGKATSCWDALAELTRSLLPLPALETACSGLASDAAGSSALLALFFLLLCAMAAAVLGRSADQEIC